MKRISRILLALWLPLLAGACATPVPAGPSAAPLVATLAPATALPAAASTRPLSTEAATPAFPQCKGMQALSEPVKFDWPNLEQRKDEFTSTAWQYYACGETAAEVAALYRGQLTRPPYNMQETNWLQRQEGTLGIYFSQTGLWHYVWFIPQPNDAGRAYVIIAESFASVEC